MTLGEGLEGFFLELVDEDVVHELVAAADRVDVVGEDCNVIHDV